VAVVMFLADMLVPALELPAWIRRLAMSAQMGKPMAGRWAWGGITASLVLAVGGLLVGGWGSGAATCNDSRTPPSFLGVRRCNGMVLG
jgi:hypothetical protein